MKTFSYILIVFTLGFFGWFGFENKTVIKENPKQIKAEEMKKTELEIRLAENYCSQLELKIQKKQLEITNNQKK